MSASRDRDVDNFSRDETYDRFETETSRPRPQLPCIRILTGAEVNSEKFCPEVVYCCTTEGRNFSVFIEASSRYLFCYITENSKNMSVE